MVVAVGIDSNSRKDPHDPNSIPWRIDKHKRGAFESPLASKSTLAHDGKVLVASLYFHSFVTKCRLVPARVLVSWRRF